MRSGYTLLEIVVALLVFTVGALALAGSSALVARAMGSDAVRDHAERVAVSRIEILKSVCEAAQSGSERVGGISSEWQVSREASRIDIQESVGFGSAEGPRTLEYKSRYWCFA